MKHKCSDGAVYEWVPRKDNPKACPRCKSRLDIKKVIVENGRANSRS